MASNLLVIAFNVRNLSFGAKGKPGPIQGFFHVTMWHPPPCVVETFQMHSKKEPSCPPTSMEVRQNTETHPTWSRGTTFWSETRSFHASVRGSSVCQAPNSVPSRSGYLLGALVLLHQRGPCRLKSRAAQGGPVAGPGVRGEPVVDIFGFRLIMTWFV